MPIYTMVPNCLQKALVNVAYNCEGVDGANHVKLSEGVGANVTNCATLCKNH